MPTVLFRRVCARVWMTAAALTLAGTVQAQSADRFAAVKVTAEPAAGSVHMLTGAGGNIAASVGDDGTLIVDSQFAPLAERIQMALDGLGGSRPKLLLNTHYHGDHTGSNAAFGGAGVIVAHHNVRLRLLGAEQTASAALPVVTFQDRLRVHFNGEDIDVMHLPNGHTDGDSVVWFRGANVIHMGDHLFTGRFPYVDVDAGGSVQGFAANLRQVLDMLPADTRVIPGHGPLDGIAAIHAAHKLVVDSVKLIEAAGDASDADIVAQLDAAFPGAGGGFINTERWLGIVRASSAGN